MDDQPPSSPIPRRSTSTRNNHQSIISLGSVSSRNSSYADSGSRYPSGMTNLTAFSSDSASFFPSGAQPPRTGQQLSEDQFDIINSLDYDDVDDGLIDHELVHRNREALVQKLFTSEQAYLESLDLVVDVFLKPLRKDSKSSGFNFLGMKKMVCTEREIRWLFGNFDDILNVQREILKSLEQRLCIWGPTQIISDVFQSWFPMLDVYHAYLDNYALAVTTYERLTRYQPFKKFIDNAHKHASLRGATLLSLLQIPAGCVNRYAQLVTKLADVTTPMHPDYAGLQQCKQKIQALEEEIRHKVNDADNVDQVLMIHQALVGAPFGVKAQRRLVLQGELARVVAGSRSGEERTYFLFSDLLAIVRPKQEGNRTVLQYKGHLNLERARIRALSADEAGGQDHCLEIVSSFQGVDTLNTTYMGAPTTHVLRTNSKEDLDKWLKHLEIVIHRLDRAAKAKNIAASRKLAQTRSTAATSSDPSSLRRLGTSSSGHSTTSSHGTSRKSSSSLPRT
ncbi:Dbl homology domain-containing protein [Syncephalastrum racemosum]|uniref:Dbl homology domain-containing protein n=1 Tax=Syncephalastrum racemosum TaxID=13706 RepID=A0A1X2H0U8_SYNRA|nr:Dbl homology domain-containing protein [Syncephalastrum racemosum]